ncbi:COP23 domain-containing protein [Okeania sp. KiyG1]|uniref:COP23 domain-containing protein n=1 Tax=Okeania sp. KiyG1 TaxID=2720165 RepID=UPI0019BBF705|nr:COP23 domain-containing protein [Okeania sp. KiyG1]GGA58881.1 hypothetical protein CYANOKiyG1_80200 [Okeania sp. KiyG1]
MAENGKIARIGKFILVVIIPIAGLLMEVVGFIDLVKDWPTLLVKKTDRFSCELKLDGNKNQKVWTVMYDNDKGKHPWLGIVIPMGGGWTPAKRCEKIEERLEYFRKDGLLSIESRRDPNTPEQEVICAKTKLSGDSCPLLLTLDVEVDGYQAMVDMTKALFDGSTVYQGTHPDFSRESPVLDLGNFLATEDKLAGDN